jgi:hypothetical protein
MTAPERFTGETTEPVDGSLQAFLRRRVVVCSATGSSYPLPPPEIGRSNAHWRRSLTSWARPEPTPRMGAGLHRSP